MSNGRHRLTVSVIVPCHNGEAYLAAALDSIFAQTRPADEVILVDDGSTDATVGIAAAYASRLRYVAQSRQGAGAARNAGIKLATGDCIGFLDADDLWSPLSLERRTALLEAEPALACVTGMMQQFSGDGAVRAAPVPTRLLGAMMVRRAVFARIGCFDTSGRLGEAFEWTARLSDSGLPTAAVEHVVMLRRIHATNTGITARDRRNEYLYALKATIDRRRTAGIGRAP